MKCQTAIALALAAPALARKASTNPTSTNPTSKIARRSHGYEYPSVETHAPYSKPEYESIPVFTLTFTDYPESTYVPEHKTYEPEPEHKTYESETLQSVYENTWFPDLSTYTERKTVHSVYKPYGPEHQTVHSVYEPYVSVHETYASEPWGPDSTIVYTAPPYEATHTIEFVPYYGAPKSVYAPPEYYGYPCESEDCPTSATSFAETGTVTLIPTAITTTDENGQTTVIPNPVAPKINAASVGMKQSFLLALPLAIVGALALI